MQTACTPRVQFQNEVALYAFQVRRPRRSIDRRTFSTGLTLLNLTTWVYAFTSAGVNLG